VCSYEIAHLSGIAHKPASLVSHADVYNDLVCFSGAIFKAALPRLTLRMISAAKLVHMNGFEAALWKWRSAGTRNGCDDVRPDSTGWNRRRRKEPNPQAELSGPEPGKVMLPYGCSRPDPIRDGSRFGMPPYFLRRPTHNLRFTGLTNARLANRVTGISASWHGWARVICHNWAKKRFRTAARPGRYRRV